MGQGISKTNHELGNYKSAKLIKRWRVKEKKKRLDQNHSKENKHSAQ